MMCGVEESTKQWSCAGRGSAYMSCRIGYMYAAGKVSIGGCRIADTQSCIRCYMHIYMPQGKCLLVDAHTRGSKESVYNTL